MEQNSELKRLHGRLKEKDNVIEQLRDEISSRCPVTAVCQRCAAGNSSSNTETTSSFSQTSPAVYRIKLSLYTLDDSLVVSAIDQRIHTHILTYAVH